MNKATRPTTLRLLTSWSFSRLSDYTTCPAKAKYKHIMKLPEPGNPAMERGLTIHKIAENYIKGALPAKVPANLESFSQLFKDLRAKYKKKTPMAMMVEDSWAFTRTWTQTRYDDWANCWLRIKVDCAHYASLSELHIYDWKTGRIRPERQEEYAQQLHLYATAALVLFPHVKVVKPALKYLDEGVTYPDTPHDVKQLTFKRKDLPVLMKAWETRTQAMLHDDIFAPRPSASCRYCHYRQENGGPCQY